MTNGWLRLRRAATRVWQIAFELHVQRAGHAVRFKAFLHVLRELVQRDLVGLVVRLQRGTQALECAVGKPLTSSCPPTEANALCHSGSTSSGFIRRWANTVRLRCAFSAASCQRWSRFSASVRFGT